MSAHTSFGLSSFGCNNGASSASSCLEFAMLRLPHLQALREAATAECASCSSVSSSGPFTCGTRRASACAAATGFLCWTNIYWPACSAECPRGACSRASWCADDGAPPVASRTCGLACASLIGRTRSGSPPRWCCR